MKHRAPYISALTILLCLPSFWFRTASDQFSVIISAIIIILVNFTLSVFLIYWHVKFLENIIVSKMQYNAEKEIAKEELKEFREWKSCRELDQKLETGHYTRAEKETLIYTSNLTSEHKNALRQKHLPSK